MNAKGLVRKIRYCAYWAERESKPHEACEQCDIDMGNFLRQCRNDALEEAANFFASRLYLATTNPHVAAAIRALKDTDK